MQLLGDALGSGLARRPRSLDVSDLAKAPVGVPYVMVKGKRGNRLYPKDRVDGIYQKASVPKKSFETSLEHYRPTQPELTPETNVPVEMGFVTERMNPNTLERRFSYEDPEPGDITYTSGKDTVRLLREVNDYMRTPDGRGLHNFYPTDEQKAKVYKHYLDSKDVEDISPDGFDPRNPGLSSGEKGHEQLVDTRKTYGASEAMRRVFEIGDQQRALEPLMGNAGLIKTLYPQGVQPAQTYINVATFRDLPLPMPPPRRSPTLLQ